MLRLKNFHIAFTLLSSLAFSGALDLRAEESTAINLKGKNVRRIEVSQTQIGFSATRVFYAVDDQRLILILHVDNTKKDFPVTGKVCQFAKDVSSDDLDKWVNNQHSDALFPEVPTPKATILLPAKSCQSLASKLLGRATALDTSYDKYSVAIKVSDVNLNEQIRLQAHTDTVTVYVVAK
jgi:hypothetical protein